MKKRHLRCRFTLTHGIIFLTMLNQTFLWKRLRISRMVFKNIFLYIFLLKRSLLWTYPIPMDHDLNKLEFTQPKDASTQATIVFWELRRFKKKQILFIFLCKNSTSPLFNPTANLYLHYLRMIPQKWQLFLWRNDDLRIKKLFNFWELILIESPMQLL